jgi:hypothetical protein
MCFSSAALGRTGTARRLPSVYIVPYSIGMLAVHPVALHQPCHHVYAHLLLRRDGLCLRLWLLLAEPRGRHDLL